MKQIINELVSSNKFSLQKNFLNILKELVRKKKKIFHS